MNKKLLAFQEYIKNKRVAVLGMGISNLPLIRYLAHLDVDITAFDLADEHKLSAALTSLEGLNIRYSLGASYLEKLIGFDIIFKTPIVRWDLPELLAEKNRGAEITSEMEVFLNLCPAKTFGITGSDGKTTTTTLVYEMLKQQGYNCWLGGNIGAPLLDKIDSITDEDMVIVELSSFQLQTITKSANTAVITNLSPNHLDVHKSYEEYIDAKKNIFRYQLTDDLCILNYDCAETRSLSKESPGKLGFFSLSQDLSAVRCHIAAYLSGDEIVVQYDNRDAHPILDIRNIRLIGKHNVDNYLAAICATARHVSHESVKTVAAAFTGVEHRIEFVRELNGVRFFNDSIASSPTRTIACLNAFDKRIILIAGGKDKNLDYAALGKHIAEKVKLLVLCGQNAPKIKAALLDHFEQKHEPCSIPVVDFDDYESAVSYANLHAASGDAIVLSPAGTSFDRFKNFEERGRLFKKLVHDLPEVSSV